MKVKRWLSRAIVLAMVLALMVPMPVAAKSAAGGKLVKSVEAYEVSNGSWKLVEKNAFTYDKKGNPKTIKQTYGYTFFAGVPVNAAVNTLTANYKYKGSKIKSMKLKNEFGKVVRSATYKNGKAVAITEENKSMNDAGVATINTDVTNAAYNKSGLAVASSNTETYANSQTGTETRSSAMVYAWTQKKGIPSLVLSNDGSADAVTCYTRFNGKGLATESGYIDEKGAYVPEYVVTYTMKKGTVKEAVVYWINNGNPEPEAMYKFKYTKTKASAKKYMNMMNDLIGYNNGFFNWEGEYFFN